MPRLLERLGHARRDPRAGLRVLLALALLYLLALALFYPEAITVSDERSYLRQAELIDQGRRSIPATHPLTGRPIEIRGASYPLGTALVLAPFVAVGGWRAAFVAPALCLVGALWLTGLWLRDAGRNPLFALLLLGFAPSLVMGRVAMSEAPSLLVAAAGLLAFWRGIGTGPRHDAWWGLAGLLAGASVLLREGNALLFAPLFAGALLRRESGVWALVVGGAVGVGLRLLSAALFFGDPFAFKPPGGFGLASLAHTLPLYLLALTVLVPGGLVFALAYRGERRPELVVTVLGVLAFYSLYDYSAGESAFSKQLVLGPRYFIPLLPLLAFAAAEVVPRLLGERRERLATGGAALAVLGIALAIVGVQWLHHAWGAGQARIRDAIYENTPDGALLVTNWRATGKFIDLVYGDRMPLRREQVGPEQMHRLARAGEPLWIVLLDRSDSAYWRAESERNAAWIAALPVPTQLALDLAATPTDRLRIWRVLRPRARSPSRPG